MLHIIQSNKMEVLQAQFHTLLKTAPLSSPFSKEVVLVQSPGMSQWLKIGLSEALGVAAQVDFPLPSSFIWQLYQQFLPNVPSESPYNKQNMTWKLVSILPSCLDDDKYAQLNQYLKEDSDGLKLFSLCEKIADVYDQYLMYRPHWISQWDSGRDELDDVDISVAAWQPDLWRRLVKHTQSLGQSDYHRANMHQQLLSALDNALDERLLPERLLPERLLPERITIFGLSAMAPSQLEVFQTLAKKIDVLLFFCNPSEHYWGDLVDEKTQSKIAAKYIKMPELEAQKNQEDYYFVGNPLLSSWGKLGRDYFEQLVQLDAQWIDGFVSDFDDSLLAQVHSEIYQLAFKGRSLTPDKSWFISDEGKLTINPEDRSIQLVDCHTPLREVECLHDHLLRLFHDNPNLTPKDIIVMMPDVGTYSPYIEAVFGAANAERFIPYALADLSIEQEKPILSSFVSLVNLPFSRFGVSDILDLLAVNPIASKFKVEEHEFSQLKYWLEQVGVKWGLDAKHKTEHDLPALSLNTWQHGLNRLLLGIASSDEQVAFADIYPADLVEGMAVNSLSKLLHFVNTLASYKLKLNNDDRLTDKAQLLREMVAQFYDAQTEQSWDLLTLESVIDDLQKHDDNLDMQSPVSARVLSYLVKQGVKEKGVGQRFLVGPVNFCTLMPMRAVPFKVVCLLGMNDADYPRTVQPIGFDLVPHSKRQKGDRSRKFDDRYLFLEALLSAREHFYISYIGRSCYNNEPQMPSVLVSELLEYVDRSFKYENIESKPSEHLLQRATLQPFNPANYCPDNKLQSYNPVWLVENTKLERQPPAPLDVEYEKHLDIGQFLFTVLAPQKAFYTQTLGLRLNEQTELNKDEEPFVLDTLERYFYLDELLAAELRDEPINLAQIMQRGNLPQAAVGEIQLARLQQRVQPMVELLKPQVKQPRAPLEVRLDIAQHTLLGWLDKLYDNKQIFYRSASIKAKDRVKGFLMHCIAQCMDEPVHTYIYGLDEQVSFAPMEKSKAHGYLQKWLSFYRACLAQPMPFFVSTAYELVATGDANKAAAKFNGGQYIGYGESEDAYVALNFTTLAEVIEPLQTISQDLLADIVTLAQEQRYADA
ncbi:exodeoxyribonuclease V subunit gamma [Pseudoalteromonas sp. JBTF-M23]|uniref:RecBCD enzyme subunit RecC n=1 Tax=Pseudoalteromonas caenipelagi TaxID=2726988 RepID=A0A849V7M2_9GAMM|nr:exodeoxyribonuclease V subunit gamma [Pseudoalteromonas caenipelagi]NOU49549.1 exodeoxyribonuclease V subunit gamma [Pseudoalteromonas caenipelagi]